MHYRPLRIGVLLWLVGTVAIRLVGQRLLYANRAGATLILYGVSFVAMACLVRRIFRRLGLGRESWPAAATLLMLPTLILDPFSCAFFTSIFPNADPGAAGVFGGWMLICCAGAVAGVWMKGGVGSRVKEGGETAVKAEVKV